MSKQQDATATPPDDAPRTRPAPAADGTAPQLSRRQIGRAHV